MIFNIKIAIRDAIQTDKVTGMIVSIRTSDNYHGSSYYTLRGRKE